MDHSWPWWRAEFEIGWRAFHAANIYTQTGWLELQIWKEWNGSGVYGPRGTDLGALTAGEMAVSAQQELAHYHGLRQLGETMDEPPGTCRPGQASRALTDYRNIWWDDPVARHGVRMSEGGGLGMLHGAIVAIATSTNPRDAAVRDCFAAIIADEAGHLGGAIEAYVARPFDAAEDAVVLKTLGKCLALKVAEREEQFAAQLVGMDKAAPEAEVAKYRANIEDLLA